MTKSQIKVKGLQIGNDPTFEAGSTHTAQATLTNPTTKQFNYDVELYLGATKVATSGVGSVTIPAGGSLVVSVAGELIEHYPAAEDVVIVTPAEFVISDLSASPPSIMVCPRSTMMS